MHGPDSLSDLSSLHDPAHYLNVLLVLKRRHRAAHRVYVEQPRL